MRSEVFSAVLTYINDHYKEEISLDTVADFSGFSRYYFSRSFRHQT
jgi:YesN/AraC family two-component response regulator